MAGVRPTLPGRSRTKSTLPNAFLCDIAIVGALLMVAAQSL